MINKPLTEDWLEGMPIMNVYFLISIDGIVMQVHDDEDTSIKNSIRLTRTNPSSIVELWLYRSIKLPVTHTAVPKGSRKLL